MLLKSPEYESAVAKRDFQAWLIYGPDQGRVGLLSAALQRHYRDGKNLAAVTLDQGVALKDRTLILDNLSSLGLFSAASALRIRDADDKLAKALDPIVSDLAKVEGRLIIEAGELTGASKLKKLFEGEAKFAAMPCWAPTERELATRAAETLKNLGVKYASGVPDQLARLSPPDSAAITMECRKLAVFANGGTLTQADIELVCKDQAEADLSAVARAIGNGDAKAAITAYARLSSAGESGVMLLRVIQRHLQRLHAARLQKDAGKDEDTAMSSLRPPVFWKEKTDFKRQIGKWPAKTLEAVIARAVEAERQVKSGLDERVTVGQFVLEAASKGAASI